MTEHECIRLFETEKIDNAEGTGSNKCFGISPMRLECWVLDQDGIGNYHDNWIYLYVNFCQFCGLKSEGTLT